MNGTARYSEFLRNRNFLLYNIGQMLSQFSDRLIQMAIIGIVYKLFNGSPTQLAKMLFCTLIPAFFVSPVAGVYIDRWNKKNVLVLTNLMMGAIVVGIPLFFLSRPAAVPLYIALFIIFAIACFFLPAKMSIVPELVAYDKLLAANSFATVLWMVAGVLGFTVGAFLMELFGVEKGLYLNAFCYLLAAITLFFIGQRKDGSYVDATRPDVPAPVQPRVSRFFLAELYEGLKYLASHDKARFVSGIFFVATSVLGALYVVSIVFIQELTGSMTAAIGLFGVFLGSGFLVGAYSFGKFGHRIARTKAILVALFLSGIFEMLFLYVFMLSGSIVWGSAVLFVLGVTVSPILTVGNTLIHESIDEQVRGRVFSSVGIIMNIGFMACMFLASQAAERIDKFWIIAACGMAVSCLGLIGFVLDKSRVISASDWGE
ncbi:MAG: MFS transporter [Candidatus Omnitrophica bacterium]|nr:MFS transporter [Candidatus Omnitrophota bacterium]